MGEVVVLQFYSLSHSLCVKLLCSDINVLCFPLISPTPTGTPDMCTCMYMCRHTCVYMCMPVYIYVCVFMCIWIYACIYVDVCARARACLHVCMHGCVHLCIDVYGFMCIWIYMHVFVYAYTHVLYICRHMCVYMKYSFQKRNKRHSQKCVSNYKGKFRYHALEKSSS